MIFSDSHYLNAHLKYTNILIIYKFQMLLNNIYIIRNIIHSYFFIINEALLPPKPKLLDIAVLIFVFIVL